ncbi:uncharacterized protein LOC124358421 [Homalodisca vitripennis]|uniref:uncharacterized protein LOC124358421 n=1 Tax=Homalodisca vitripennis TaxID=197043 RepID=UPI001EECC493|nr:uncharacterized protein LOC124358421 [Homalodisca vitripennis]
MRSLNTGFDEMSALTTDFGFDIFGVTESWLSPSTPSDHYEIPGYTLLRADRAVGTGGGVALYIKQGMVFERIQITSVDPGIELISLILKIRGVKLCVAVVYRPPHNVKWEAAKDMNNTEDINAFVTSKIIDIYDAQAPLVTKRVTKKKAPWRNEEVIMLTKLKNKLRSKFAKSRQEFEWTEYKKARNRLNGAIRNAKKNFFADKLADCKDPRAFWRCLKQSDIVGKKNNNLPPKAFKVSEMNEYFVNMGSFYQVNEDLISSYNQEIYNGEKKSFEFKEVSEYEVRSVINEITSRAVGVDKLSIAMIKAVSPYAIEAITHLMNTSLKKGFRKNHSTCTALLNMFADVFGSRDAGRCSSIIMLDYSQAFDSISHSLLLAKLKHFGFHESAIVWFKSYLEKRLQVTKLGTDISPPLEKLRGVPQGSCLGPILFTLYTADLSNCVSHCKVHAYADDCQLHFSYESDSINQVFAGVNSDLERIDDWSRKHGLKLNAEKCMILHIAPPTVCQKILLGDMHVKLGDKMLMVSDTVKTLGVVLDRGLTFSDHITHVSQLALGRLRGLYRYRSILPESAKLQLVQSLVLSVLYYCFPAYGQQHYQGGNVPIAEAAEHRSALRLQHS